MNGHRLDCTPASLGAPRPGLNRREFLTASFAAAVLSGCHRAPQGGPAGVNADQAAKAAREAAEAKELQDVRDTLVTYMGDPRFVGPDFVERLTGEPVRLEKHYVDIETLCFSIAGNDFRGVEESLGRLAMRPDDVRFAYAGVGEGRRFLNTRDGDAVTLGLAGGRGTMTYRGLGRYVFAVDEGNIRVDADRPIVYERGGVRYDVTPRELDGFLSNARIYRGYRYIVEGEGAGRRSVTVNFGGRVARPGEPSLTRFVDRIVGREEPPEVRAQRIIDVASQGIAYSTSDVDFEKANNLELVKRPNEVLMSGEGDCASKALLLASLYDQAGLDYYLVYVLPSRRRAGHLTTLVQGAFGDGNGMTFDIGGRPYAISDPTVQGFRIGATRLVLPITLEDMTYVQRPADGSVFEARTGRVVREGGVDR